MKPPVKRTSSLLELLSCLVSSIFPGAVVNLAVHMLHNSLERRASPHLVVQSLCVHIPYPLASQQQISEGSYFIRIACLIWPTRGFMPFNECKNKTKQVWITFHIPKKKIIITSHLTFSNLLFKAIQLSF